MRVPYWALLFVPLPGQAGLDLLQGHETNKRVCTADMRGDIRSESDVTMQHGVLFLLTVRLPDQAELTLLQQHGKEMYLH